MFTGIVTHIAKVEAVNLSKKNDLFLTISLPQNQVKRKLVLGCSIALNGICLTLVKQEKLVKNLLLSFQASNETCAKTNLPNWKVADKINVEFALRVGDELGGHIVSGHVDDLAKIIKIQKIKESHRFVFEASGKLKKFIIAKGSVTLNGVSLTVNKAETRKLTREFEVNIIPHTMKNTTFGQCREGDLVNLEIDVLARYALSHGCK